LWSGTWRCAALVLIHAGKAPAGNYSAGAIFLLSFVKLLAFDDFAGLDAAGADANALASTGDLSFDGLEVYVPAATGGVVGVRDVVAELRAFAAKITFVCHDCSNPESQKFPGGRA
jgi:hypothetical protein